MKKGIHPDPQAVTVNCSGCGGKFVVMMVTTDLKNKNKNTADNTLTIPVCSKCHPVYTGGPINTERMSRVQIFMKKWGYKPDQQEKQKEQKA